MQPEIQIHYEYEKKRRPSKPPRHLQSHLKGRRQALSQPLCAGQSSGRDLEEEQWLRRSYPILAIVAPVMSTNEGKIEFPGDPMCLYSALSYAVDQVVQARQRGFGEGAPYNDLCPQWGYLPSPEYRANVDPHGIRQYDSKYLNTDQTVFDPRVWNETVRDYFVNKVLLVI